MINRRHFLTFLSAGLLSTSGLAISGSASKINCSPNPLLTTWAPQDFNCPVCKTRNTFRVIMSFGSYIYGWPSKYQWVFWPLTDSPYVYLCKQCHLAVLMSDFEEIPKNKIPLLQSELIKIPFNRKFKEYLEVPVSERLEIAEKVYTILNRQEDDFWNQFYRLKGYHYGKEKQAAKALEARQKALALTQKMIKDPASKTPQKELWYISGAMKHFTDDDKGAVADLKKGLETKFASASAKPEELKDAEDGMNERLNDYIARINSSNPPRSMDSKETD